MIIKKAPEPDEIIWKNLENSTVENRPRMVIVSSIFLIIALIIALTNIFIGQAMDTLGLEVDCDNLKTDLYGAFKAQRWIDSLQEFPESSETSSLVLSDNMICFCDKQTSRGSSPGKASNKDFKKIEPTFEDMPNYCNRYVNLIYQEQTITQL